MKFTLEELEKILASKNLLVMTNSKLGIIDEEGRTSHDRAGGWEWQRLPSERAILMTAQGFYLVVNAPKEQVKLPLDKIHSWARMINPADPIIRPFTWSAM